MESTRKRNDIIRKSCEDYQLRYGQFEKLREEKAYRIRCRKLRNDEGWVPANTEQLMQQ